MAINSDRFEFTPAAWNVGTRTRPGYGRPTAANLTHYVAIFNASTEPGGVNAHLSGTRITAARIVDQRTGEVVATWYAAPIAIAA